MTFIQQIKSIKQQLNQIKEEHIGVTAQEIAEWFAQHHIEMVVIPHDPPQAEEKPKRAKPKRKPKPKQASLF